MAVDGRQFNNDQSDVDGMAALGDLPIVRETDNQPVWDEWGAQWRDLHIVNPEGELVEIINLTGFDPDPSVNGGQNFEQLKAMFLAAATG